MKKGTAITYAVGIITGLALAGPASAAVRQLTATPSTQSFYVNGQRTQFEAYAIGGNNYVKLRDIGKAVDFGVTYDGATNSVYIDTSAHYQQEVTQPAPATPSLSTITEESVYNVLMALKAQYPHGTLYGSPYQPIIRLYGNSDKCAGWAMKCSDAAFGMVCCVPDQILVNFLCHTSTQVVHLRRVYQRPTQFLAGTVVLQFFGLSADCVRLFSFSVVWFGLQKTYLRDDNILGRNTHRQRTAFFQYLALRLC